jgi:hypothetical protein
MRLFQSLKDPIKKAVSTRVNERQPAHSIAEGYWRINRVAAIETNFLAADAYRPPAAWLRQRKRSSNKPRTAGSSMNPARGLS